MKLRDVNKDDLPIYFEQQLDNFSNYMAAFTAKDPTRAAKDNTASIRVLKKYGFKICDEDKGFSNARAEEVEEYVLKLSSKAE